MTFFLFKAMFMFIDILYTINLFIWQFIGFPPSVNHKAISEKEERGFGGYSYLEKKTSFLIFSLSLTPFSKQ